MTRATVSRHWSSDLLRQTVHQVQVDVVEAGAAAALQRSLGLFGIMAAAQHRQQTIVHALHADAHPVDAGGAEFGALLGRQVVGIALGGYLGVGADSVVAGDSIQDAGHLAVGQVGRGAAAEENGVNSRATQGHGPGGNLPDDGGQEVVELGLDTLVGVEVTVRALAQAEGHVHVQRDALVQFGNGTVMGWRGLKHNAS